MAVQRGDVEALDAHGRRVEGERALELEQRLVGAVIGVARAHHVAHERVAGVGRRHVQEVALLAALRVVDVAGAPALLGEPLREELGVRKVDVHVNLGGNICRLVVVALEEAALKLDLPHVGALVEDELDRAHRAALAHHEDAGSADGLLAVEAYEVE